MHNLKKTINRFHWAWIQKCTLLLLVVANVALGIKLASTHFELVRLQKEEQRRLDENFPPLTTNQINSYLGRLFPELSRFDQEYFGKHVKYRVYDKTNLIGYAYQVREDIWCPVCKDVRFIIGIDTDNMISGIVLVNPFHFYGKPLASELVDEFVEQFLGKRLNN